MGTSTLDRDPFEQLAEEFAERLRRGEHPSLTEYIGRCPDRADDIRDLFPALAMVERFKPSAAGPVVPVAAETRPAAADLPERLGDYRILRYLGEGGMGVVYEAVRESLRSHVALKVMHPQYRNRENYLRRFRTEARSAARLHHTNIVSVFDYGVHDGVCYYAMQYIAGQSLDKVLEDIRQLRRENEGSAAAHDTGAQHDIGEGRPADRNGHAEPARRSTDALRQTVTLGLLTGRYAGAPPSERPWTVGPSVLQAVAAPKADIGQSPAPSAPIAECLAAAVGTTVAVDTWSAGCSSDQLGVERDAAPLGATAPERRPAEASDPGIAGEVSVSSLSGRAGDRYYREVARLGVQVADALAYAHQRGVLHRDIKPPNLILDPLGNVWITDFGLAKFEDAEDLSNSQDVIGTLRYMAPERFRGDSTSGCDVYALGATLYEMITLRPPFEGKDQLRLIRQIENDSPVPPREIDRRIPRDLETIVLKALAKGPEDRFATAKEMADELRRFVENRPIRSRSTPIYQRFWRWCKRDPGLATASLTAAALVVVLAVGATLAAWSYRTQLTKVEASQALALAENEKGQKQLFQALYERARAQRFSRQVGQRFQSLAALDEAARVGRSLNLPLEKFEPLRDEAIASMALPDMEATGRVITKPPGTSEVAFDPTMARYALAFRDGTVSVRRAVDDREVTRFRARGDREIVVLEFSPDGRYLAAGNHPAGLTVWDAERRAVALEDPGPISWGHAICFGPDSRRLYLAHDDGMLLGYALATGRIVRSYRGPGPAAHLAIRPDGGRIAALYDEKTPTCRIITTETGQLVRTLALPARGIWLDWGPDGTTLATPCADGKIYLWDAATGIRRATLEGHINFGVRGEFHPDGTLLASTGWEGRLWLWDPILGRPWLNLTGGYVSGLSRDGRIVVEFEDKLSPYQVDPALEYRTVAHASDKKLNYARPSIRHDGRVLAVGTDRGAMIWDLAHGIELAFLPIGNAWNLMFEPSGDLITSGSIGVQRWPIRVDAGRGDFRIGPPTRLPLPASLCGIAEDRSGRIVALANHAFAYVATPERTVRVGPLDDCRGVSVSPDGQWLATGTHFGRGAQVWRLSDFTKVADLPLDYRTSIAFSPDGKWLATEATPCRLWEVGTWREVLQIGGTLRGFSRDGRLMLVFDTNRVLRLVETETGRILAQLESPDSCQVGSTTFSPDGSRLVFSSNDGPAVHVWDLRRIRRRLVEMGLDWDAPPFPETDPAAESSRSFSNIVVDPGPYKAELLPLLAQAAQLQHSGDVGGAIDRLGEAVRVSPDYAPAHNNLAWLLLTAPRPHRNLDEAIRHARRAVELQPGDQVSLNTLGVALYRAGRFAHAIETLEKSLVAGKGGLAAFDLFFLAMAHHRLGHVDQARSRLDEAKRWMDARRKLLHPDHLKELTDFRAEAEVVLGGAELPADVFAEPR